MKNLHLMKMLNNQNTSFNTDHKKKGVIIKNGLNIYKSNLKKKNKDTDSSSPSSKKHIKLIKHQQSQSALDMTSYSSLYNSTNLMKTTFKTLNSRTVNSNISSMKNLNNTYLTLEKKIKKEQNNPIKAKKILPKINKERSVSNGKFLEYQKLAKNPFNNTFYRETPLNEIYKNILYIKRDKKIKKEKQKQTNQSLLNDNIYQIEKNYIKKMIQIKNINEIAKRKDFVIDDYHNMLLKFTGINARRDLLMKMRLELEKIKKESDLTTGYRIRFKDSWEILADKVGDYIPNYLANRFRSMSKERVKEYKKKKAKIDFLNQKFFKITQKNKRAAMMDISEENLILDKVRKNYKKINNNKLLNKSNLY